MTRFGVILRWLSRKPRRRTVVTPHGGWLTAPEAGLYLLGNGTMRKLEKGERISVASATVVDFLSEPFDVSEWDVSK